MGHPKKSQFVKKRFFRDNGDWPDKDGTCFSKSTMRKRKLSDMIGPQWSKEELGQFYEAYRRYGKDWKKVAARLRSRSLDMVEALYNMNRAFLSLPEGKATAAGLIAMMTDNYNNQDGSNSHGESNQVLKTTCKSQKCGHGILHFDAPKRFQVSRPDALENQSRTLNSGYLSLLGNDRIGDLLGGSRPVAVGRRSPRIPSWRDKSNRDGVKSPNKLGSKSKLDAIDDGGAHEAALALAEAAKRGGLAQPEGREEHIRTSPLRSTKTRPAGSETANIDYHDVGLDGDLLEDSLRRKEADTGILIRDATLPNNEGSDASNIQQKMKKSQYKRSRGSGSRDCHFNREREAFNVTKEALDVKYGKYERRSEVTKGKINSDLQGQRNESHLVFSPDEIWVLSEDERIALDALQSLADVANFMLPASAVECESSGHDNERKRNIDSSHTTDIIEPTLGNHESGKSKSEKRCRWSTSSVRVDDSSQEAAKQGKDIPSDNNESSKAKQATYLSIIKTQKRKRKSLPVKKIPKAGAHSESHPNETPMNEASVEREKTCYHQPGPFPRQGKAIHEVDQPSVSANQGRTVTDLRESTSQVSSLKHFNMLSGTRSKLKLNLKRAMAQTDWKSSDRSSNESYKHSHSVGSMTVDIKEKFSHCLSSQMLRRWSAFEWFYSAIDYPWFARNEFVDYLNHIQLSHVSKLTRVEWSIIRSSLGKPRRLSQQFLLEEREKLEQYRESVRTYYAELCAGVREGFPPDVARPLSAGQRVVARHPKTREIHDGSILTLDRSQYRVQFDRPDLGVEFVLDIDCMPLNPWENMPEDLKKQHALVSQFCKSSTDRKSDGQWKMGDSTMFAPTGSLEVANATDPFALSNFLPMALNKQPKMDITSAFVVAKDTAHDVAATASQPCMLSPIQAREAEIGVLPELTRALEKKEALLIELKHMNKEVDGRQIDGDLASNSEHFRKQYTMVLPQLQEASDQVASALLDLRQRITYNGNSTFSLPRSIEDSGLAECSGPFDNFDPYNYEAMSHVLEVVKSSRLKARNMVDVAVQAMSSPEHAELAHTRTDEALGSRCPGADSSRLEVRSFCQTRKNNLSVQDQAALCILEPATAVHCPEVQSYSDVTGAEIPSELISACVATFLMIQACTERQYPPAEVAQILEAAVASLQPRSSQNIPIYREIETCMGIIKNQMLALIPMPNTSLPAEVV